MLSHGLLSAEAVQWLRDSTGLSIWPGRKRIYIRRSGQGTRIGGGGGISESGDFRALLESLDLEIVEFGNGDLSVEDQLSKLKDVGLIVAAHGAALANIAYLNSPLTIIEIAGINAARPTYLHLSSFLGFRHKMIVSGFYDREGNIVVDVVELANAIEDAMQMIS